MPAQNGTLIFASVHRCVRSGPSPELHRVFQPAVARVTRRLLPGKTLQDGSRTTRRTSKCTVAERLSRRAPVLYVLLGSGRSRVVQSHFRRSRQPHGAGSIRLEALIRSRKRSRWAGLVTGAARKSRCCTTRRSSSPTSSKHRGSNRRWSARRSTHRHRRCASAGCPAEPTANPRRRLDPAIDAAYVCSR